MDAGVLALVFGVVVYRSVIRFYSRPEFLCCKILSLNDKLGVGESLGLRLFFGEKKKPQLWLGFEVGVRV